MGGWYAWMRKSGMELIAQAAEYLRWFQDELREMPQGHVLPLFLLFIRLSKTQHSRISLFTLYYLLLDRIFGSIFRFPSLPLSFFLSRPSRQRANKVTIRLMEMSGLGGTDLGLQEVAKTLFVPKECNCCRI